jgi:putative cell wall-binding protein
MGKRWSQDVTNNSNALDLDDGVFAWSDPKRIAVSLKHSAEASKRRKSSPYQSAMSMLTFYINRAGKQLPTRQKDVLERAKEELKALFGKTEA